MSWQFVVFALLAVVIVAGVAWYERSAPSSRMIALVAALSALAVAGRLALAPIPNVVATTDIALITGYALGGAPGFAVGALAAPVSNFWLGQGPWTPWQMAGWGLVGLAGAVLARLSGRRMNRLELACACALAGFAYGALLDLSVMVSYGGEQSLDRYLALSARGLPFNVAHAAGNFALALAAGPALVRMIARYRTRLEFTWRPASAPLAAVAIALVLGGVASVPATARAAGPSSARAYLEHVQRSDGGYGFAPGSRSSAQMTGWAILGMEAGGRNPLDVSQAGSTPVDYLRSRADRIGRTPSDLELAIMGLEGAGLDSRHFAGHDLPAQLLRLQGGDGSFGGQVNITAYAILALRAAGVSSGIRPAASWLRGAQNRDGGWGSNGGGRSEPDSTGSAIQALHAAAGGGAVGDGVSYLKRVQKGDGGWGLYETGVTNTQSTAFAVMGLVAAGVDPAKVRRSGRSGASFMAARQAGDGHYSYSSSGDQTPIWVTSQALLALQREALPIESVPRSAGGAPSPAPDVPITSGGGAGAAGGGAEGADNGGHDGNKGNKRHRQGTQGEAHGARGGVEAPSSSPRPRLRAVVGDPTAATAPPGSGSSGSDSLPWVAGGFIALTALLAGGFLWYRRRLP